MTETRGLYLVESPPPTPLQGGWTPPNADLTPALDQSWVDAQTAQIVALKEAVGHLTLETMQLRRDLGRLTDVMTLLQSRVNALEAREKRRAYLFGGLAEG